MSDMIVAPTTRDLDDLGGQLKNYLIGKLPGATDLRIANPDYPRGAGQSHETILFDALWSKGGQEYHQGMVIRFKPTGYTVFLDDLFEQQFRIMQLLHAGGQVPVARPLWLEMDGAGFGQPFFVMEKVRGRVPVSIPPYSRSGFLFDAPVEKRRHLWSSAVTHLARLQHVPVSDLEFLAGSAQAPRGLAQEWDKYSRFVEWLRDDPRHEFLELARQRLMENWPDNQPEGLVWGDARIGNMMFDDNFDVVAMMDWEQPSLGGALHDLAWFIQMAERLHGKEGSPDYFTGMGTRDETIALWEDVSGKSAVDLEWYEDFTQLKRCCCGVRTDILKGTQSRTVEQIRAQLRV